MGVWIRDEMGGGRMENGDMRLEIGIATLTGWWKQRESRWKEMRHFD